MNYYPFHIGDFAAHTAHLTWEEDIAYRRMLDWYYLNEKALPLDKTKLARLIRMPKSLQAIDTVLGEFFIESPDGWHNKRADEELTSMLAKQEQQATKDEHEADRMRRYRERRAEMFSALRAVQVVPAWDVPIKELQRLFDTHCNAPATPPATDLQREQVISGNAPATAIPIPTPTPTPIPTPIVIGDSAPASQAPKPPKRASQLPADFYPNETGVSYAEQRLVALAVELESFRNHHEAKGSTFKDWQAAWRTWCDKAVEFGRAGGQKPQALSFAERDELAKRKRWEEMTGRKWPTTGQAPEFTDIDTINQLALEAS